MGIKKTFNKLMRKGFQLVTGSPLAQESVRNTDSQKAIAAGIDAKEIALARCAAAEGCVLLKNIGHTLPLLKEEEVAVFGRCQRDYFYVGYGSGGDVNPPYLISLMDGLDLCGASYDKKLAEIYDPPAVLYMNGPRRSGPREKGAGRNRKSCRGRQGEYTDTRQLLSDR